MLTPTGLSLVSPCEVLTGYVLPRHKSKDLADNQLWAVFAVMLVVDLIVIGWHFTIPRGQRLFHQISIVVLTTATIAYFSMASNLGATPIATEFRHLGYPIGTLRQIWVSLPIL